MPIKPENRALYPVDWPAISLAVKERAGWRCMHPGCRAAQYAVGTWRRFDDEWRWRPVKGNVPAATRQDWEFHAAGEGLDLTLRRWTCKAAREFIARWCWPADEKPIVIVLTVAHLNHDPTDCSPENLAAMCQRHHLAHDHHHHLANAQATRRSRLAAGELF